MVVGTIKKLGLTHQRRWFIRGKITCFCRNTTDTYMPGGMETCL